jgi:ADP-ribose pyrophosphatase YjhB (NUDIX family)
MQKYQVFINEHKLELQGVLKRNQQSGNVLEVIDATLEEVKCLINWLFEEGVSAFNVQVVVNEPELLWKEFQQLFVLIEAAGGLVANKKGELLFIHRLGKWDLPKGKMESGESPIESALREVEEECGITQLTAKESFGETYHMYRHEGKVVLKKTYWFLMEYGGEEQLVPQAEEGIEQAVWVNTKQMEEQIEHTYVSLKSMLRSYADKS